MSKIVHFIISCFLFQATLFAQIPGLTQFTNNNGLASNTVYDAIQDENGFMWFATDYGLSKYDGLTFKNFTIADGLPGNEILFFYKDSQNRIWMATFNGNIGYIQNGKFFNYINSPFLKKLKSASFISDIFEDSNGEIWFYQNLKNINVLQTNLNIKNYSLRHDIDFKSTSLIVEDIHHKIRVLTYKVKNNKTFIISKAISENSNGKKREEFNPKAFTKSSVEKINNNLGIFLQNSNEFSKTISKNLTFIRNNYLSKTYKIGADYWTTNLNKGVLIFLKSDNYINPKTILKNVRTTRAFVDLENNIWIGSQSNGVYLFPNLHINGVQFEKEKKNDLHTVNFFQNKIVVGNELSEIMLLNTKTLKTIATYKVDKQPKRIRKLKVQNKGLYILSDYSIQCLNSDLKLEKIINMYDPDFSKTKLVNFKDICNEKDFIFTANAAGVSKINKNTKTIKKLWDKRSTAICKGKNDNLWIGTTSGLYKYKNDTVEKYNLNEHFNNSIIYALKNTQKGLLIGSNSYGFGILKNNLFKTYTTKDGLLSNYIKSIFVDAENNIWLSTNLGLNCIELNVANEIKSIKSYTTSDGLYSNDVRASYVHENNVYVATSKGLNIINLSNEAPSIIKPKVILNEVLLNNTLIEKLNEQAFNYKLNNFQFNFSGISFKSLGNISFKYRLSGLEKDWITTKNNTIRYSSLPPHEYTFELKAISKNKLESAPILFSFTINPPIYKTWWFQSLFIVIIIALIIFIFHRRNIRLIREHATKEQISNLKYQALNAQMNPHFINNLLVNINALADKGALKEVKASLDKFGELVNLILNSTKSNLISLTNEIEMAKLYLDLQKLRFNNNISYAINTESISQDELETILVPPMILQPIIENSFKHGFKNENNSNNITVNFSIEHDEFLICEISDNGKGIQKDEHSQKSKGSGISFSNINERLQLINEANSEEKLVSISNITNEFDTLVGLKVTLKIPFISF